MPYIKFIATEYGTIQLVFAFLCSLYEIQYGAARYGTTTNAGYENYDVLDARDDARIPE